MKNLLEEYPLFHVDAVDSIRDVLAGSAQLFPDKTALQDLNNTPIPQLTFSMLHQYVLRFGEALRKLGVRTVYNGGLPTLPALRLIWSWCRLTQS